MANDRIRNLISRLPARATAAKQGSALEHISYAAKAAEAIYDRFVAARDVVAGNASLSAIGKSEAMVEPIRHHVTRIREQLGIVTRMHGDMENRRLAMRPKAPEPTDTAGALLRQEIRSYLRTLPAGERIQAALTGDPKIVEAVMTAPLMLSGIPEEAEADITRYYLQTKFGPQLAEIEEDESAAEVAAVSLRLAYDEIQRGSGLDPAAFEHVAGPLMEPST